jgi:GntR family transcriptional regulator
MAWTGGCGAGEVCVAFTCTIWHSTRVISFRVQFRPGIPLYEQVVYSAKKAMMSGRLRPGDPFPSVRILSRELKINPNTAHKVVTQLAASGLVEIRPGVGTIVAAHPEASAAERAQLLSHEIEELVVEAKRLGIDLQDIVTSVSEHWKRLSARDALGGQPDREGSRKR